MAAAKWRPHPDTLGVVHDFTWKVGCGVDSETFMEEETLVNWDIHVNWEQTPGAAH